MGKLLYLPRTKHELRLVPGLPSALEKHYAYVRVSNPNLFARVRQFWDAVGLMGLFQRWWSWPWT